MFGQFAQMPLPIAATRGFVGSRTDKRTDAPARLQNSGAFQFGINLGHRIRVDAQINRQLPYCRQLIADARLRQPRTAEIDLWDSAYLFLFVISCFVAEWALRKRLGLA